MYIEGIDVKLIFGWYADPDWSDYCEIEAALVANKNDLNKEKNIRAKAR